MACLVTCADGVSCPSHLACFDGVCKTPQGTCSTDVDPDAAPCVVTLGGNGADGAGLFVHCLAPDPGSKALLGTIDTSDKMQCTQTVLQQGTQQMELCVIAADTITIADTLTATGSRPLVIAAVNTLEVAMNGVVDVASHRAGSFGAGAISALADCEAGQAQMTGGGAGGSFGTIGGDGGDGGAGTGASAMSAPTPGTVRPGCSGTSGGPSAGGLKGAAGGAVYLVAGGALTIRGTINASGASGTGGLVPNGGGGGGGSGGLIGLDAPMIHLFDTAIVMANGGAGGGGASSVTPGGDGSDPQLSTPGNPAAGGVGAGGAANAGGGATAVVAAANGGDSTTAGGGGGGGGGLGRTFAFGAITIDPAAVTSPAIATSP
ncbi:MAG: hypothetical protein AB7L28_23110 [Kofleriaceae bacterium]